MAAGRQVTIVDLDTVEPFYTLRPIKKRLEEAGLNVIAWEPSQTMGLGEAGSLIKQEMIWALKNKGDIIMDVGYGVHGAKIFNIIEGAGQDPDLKIIAVVNASRPMTSTVEDIVDYIESLGKIDGLVNNTHLADETSPQVINEGAVLIRRAAEKLGLPVLYTSVPENLVSSYPQGQDPTGTKIKKLTRWMPDAFW